MLLHGTVMTGKGIAAGLTQLDWFREAVGTLGGFQPFPGTLNLDLDDAAPFNALLLRWGTTLVPPSTDTCCALLLGARLSPSGAGREGGAGGAEWAGVVVRPLTADYRPTQVEVVAGVHLRAAMGLRDGDRVALRLAALLGPRWLRPGCGA
jgi:riboflavin kinase